MRHAVCDRMGKRRGDRSAEMGSAGIQEEEKKGG